jgi:hypothetical protein
MQQQLPLAEEQELLQLLWQVIINIMLVVLYWFPHCHCCHRQQQRSTAAASAWEGGRKGGNRTIVFETVTKKGLQQFVKVL